MDANKQAFYEHIKKFFIMNAHNCGEIEYSDTLFESIKVMFNEINKLSAAIVVDKIHETVYSLNARCYNTDKWIKDANYSNWLDKIEAIIKSNNFILNQDVFNYMVVNNIFNLKTYLNDLRYLKDKIESTIKLWISVALWVNKNRSAIETNLEKLNLTSKPLDNWLPSKQANIGNPENFRMYLKKFNIKRPETSSGQNENIEDSFLIKALDGIFIKIYNQQNQAANQKYLINALELASCLV